MKYYKLLFLLIVCSSIINAQSPEKVIRQYFKSIGGFENWKNVERIEKKQHVKIENERLTDLIIRTYVSDTKGFRWECIFNKDESAVMVISEDRGWLALNFSINLDGNKESLDRSRTTIGTDDDLDLADSVFLKEQWKKYILHDLTSYKSKGSIINSLGEFDNINGEQAIGIKMVRNNVENEFYFSHKTHNLLRFKTKGIQVNYADYKNVGKLKIPFEVEEVMLDHKLERGDKTVFFSTIYIIDEVIINPKFDESIFLKPNN